MKKKKILCIIGTRPEAIKMCPLVLALRSVSEFDTSVCLSGQHGEMLYGVLDIFGVKADCALPYIAERRNLSELSSKLLIEAEGLLDRIMPDVVLVHGDTATAFCGALAAFYRRIPIGHVEAGLRSGDINEPYPEEFNRQAVGIVAKYNLIASTGTPLS